MKILKRNQLIILVISLMLITAGYLNFTSSNNTVQTSQIVGELGDAKLVSSMAISTGENVATAENKVVEKEVIQINEQESIETAKVEDSYFTTSKLERESMYSQMLETYQEIYNNTYSTAEQKVSALAEISKINKTKNAIMIAENLTMAKGFEKVVIFANNNSVSVIIGIEELKQEQIAQIQNIVSRELEVDAEIIHISTK